MYPGRIFKLKNCNFASKQFHRGCFLGDFRNFQSSRFYAHVREIDFVKSKAVNMLFFSKRNHQRRSSIKNGVLKNFAKVTENACVRVSFIAKLQALSCSFIKKRILAQVISCKFC